MASFTIDLGVLLEESALKRLRLRLQKMSLRDEITIRLESAYSYEEKILIKELERMGYDYQSYGGGGNDFYVIVKKRLH